MFLYKKYYSSVTAKTTICAIKGCTVRVHTLCYNQGAESANVICPRHEATLRKALKFSNLKSGVKQ